MGIISDAIGGIAHKLGVDEGSALDKVIDVGSSIGEGLVDGALVMSGPVGWAVLAGKTAADAAFTDSSLTEAIGSTALSAGLGVLGGGVAKGAAQAASSAGATGLKGAASKFTLNATSKVDDIVGKGVGSLSQTTKLGPKWTEFVTKTNGMGAPQLANLNRTLTTYGDDFVKARMGGQSLLQASKIAPNASQGTVTAAARSKASELANVLKGQQTTLTQQARTHADTVAQGALKNADDLAKNAKTVASKVKTRGAHKAATSNSGAMNTASAATMVPGGGKHKKTTDAPGDAPNA